ncbi:MAG: hypothetical protein AMXMBFR13_10730 [Phycisphaerae bacterium]
MDSRMADNPQNAAFEEDPIEAALREAGVLDTETAGPSADAVVTEQPAPEAVRLDSAGRPFDEIAAAMAAAIETESAVAPGSAPASTFAIPELDAMGSVAAPVQGIDLLRDVELNVKIELGRSSMLIDEVLRLGEGSVVELDKLAGDPVDVFVNDRLIARGEVLVLNDSFCVRINDIVKEDAEEER